MVRFEMLLNVQRVEARNGSSDSGGGRRHVVGLSHRRTAPTCSTLPSTQTSNDFKTSLRRRKASLRPIALPWLRLIKYLRHYKLPFFLFFMLSQMVLVHDPIGLFRLPIFAKVRVKNQDFFAALLLPVRHHRPSLSRLVPPCFTAL